MLNNNDIVCNNTLLATTKTDLKNQNDNGDMNQVIKNFMNEKRLLEQKITLMESQIEDYKLRET